MSVANNNGTRHLTRGFGIVAKAVMRDKTIPAPARALYAVLCTYADDNGECYPSNETLAADMGCTDKSIRNYLGDLVTHGVVRREPRYVEGRQTTSVTVLSDAQIAPRGEHSFPPEEEHPFPLGGERTFLQNNTTKNETTRNDSQPSVEDPPENSDSPKRSRRKRATTRPEDFAVAPSMLEWARNEGAPSKAWVEQRTKAFFAWTERDDKRFVNWEAGWRNSILGDLARLGSNNGNGGGAGNGGLLEEFDADGYALDDMRRGIRRGPQKLDFE